MTPRPLPTSGTPEEAADTPSMDSTKLQKGARGRQSYGRTAKMGALWSVMRQGGNELVGLPASMFMARLLSPADFGIAAAASFFILLSARLTQFGFAAALVRIKELRPEHATSVFVVNLGMGVLTFGALFAGAPLIGQFFRSPEAGGALPVAALTFLINPFGTVPAALMHRDMQFRNKALADWTDSLVGSVASVLLAFQGWSYWSIVYGQLLAVTVRVMLQMYLAGWTPALKVSRRALRELLSFGLGVQSKRVLEYAAFNLDNVVVGRVLGMAALGIYDKAFVTMNRLVTRLTLGQAPFRIFSIIHEDRERFRRAYSRLILSVTLIGFPVLTGCMVAAEPLFVVMYGKKWLPAVLPFQLLCAGGMLKLLNAYASQANEAAGNIWPQVRRQAIGMVLVVVGAAVGSATAGVPGAALGVLAAMVLLTIAMQTLVRQATGLSWSELLTPQIPALTCSAVLAGLLMAVEAALRAVVRDPAAWQLLSSQVAAGISFYGVFVLFGPFRSVRQLVEETLDDMLPARLQTSIWRRKALRRA